MTKAQLVNAKITNAYADGKTDGLREGIEIGRKEVIAELTKKRETLDLRCFHLEGAVFLVKTLYEQLRLAGVNEYVQRRS